MADCIRLESGKGGNTFEGSNPSLSSRHEAGKVNFKIGDVVRHLKSDTRYRIELTPDRCRLEATCEPAYGYCREDNTDPTIWIRSAVLMEDGRFELDPD